MNEQRRRVLESKYVLVDFNRLKADTVAHNKEIGDGLGVSGRCFQNGMSHSTMSNCKNNYDRNEDAKEWREDFEHCEVTGIFNKSFYKVYCDIFNLDGELYILKKKPIEVEEVTSPMPQIDVYGELILAQLTELTKAINNLGSIEMQNMEYLKELKDCWKGDKE